MALYYRYRAVVYMACGSAVVWKIWAYRGELVRYYRLPRGTTAVDFYRGGPTLHNVIDDEHIHIYMAVICKFKEL